MALYRRAGSAILLGLLFTTTLPGQDRPLPDTKEFTAQVRKHLVPDEELQAGYMFTERRVEQKLDSNGRVTSETVRVFEVYPGLPGQRRYRRLVSENGKPVEPAVLERHDRERREAAEAHAKSLQTPAQQERIARDTQQRRQRYEAAIDDLFRIYDIRLVRRERVDGHPTIVTELEPRPDAAFRTDEGKIMRHFKVRAWVSESDHQVVKVEAEAIRDLSFGLGLLARVHKGTVASYQRRQVNNETWLPLKVTWTASGRMLVLRRLRLRGISEFSDYRKFSVDTSVKYHQP